MSCEFCIITRYYASEKSVIYNIIDKVKANNTSLEELKKKLCKKHYKLIKSNLEETIKG